MACGSRSHMTQEQLGKLLLSSKHRQADNGRQFVCVSLAEAETIRRVLHARDGNELIDGAATRLALRHISSGSTPGAVLDASFRFEEGPMYQSSIAIQCCRFLDGQLFFSHCAANLLDH